MSKSRFPAVAGSFYPGNPVVLAGEIDAMLEEAAYRASRGNGRSCPKAVIVPHAGYVYSGPVAAGAYARVRSGNGVTRRVVLLGPVHRVAIHGLALPAAAVFETPLGSIPLDGDACGLLRAFPQITVNEHAHALEHSLEVQLPFLQRVLGAFSLIPLAVGDVRPEMVAEVLDCLWGGEETLIVVSSDLSHYLPYDTANLVDQETVRILLNLELIPSYGQACGAVPVNGIITAARRRRLVPELIDLRNSGDTGGDKGRVVGYASIAFYEEVSHV